MLIVLLTVVLPLAHARIALWGACSIEHNRLDANTKAFVTDCDSFGFCAANGTCVPRQCRHDEFVLTSLLESNLPVPPLCPAGSFCPDDASGCVPWVQLGGRCELNRDDECTPPLNPLVVPSPWGQPPGSGAVCLASACMWANATLGSTCVLESTMYIGYDTSGMSFSNEVLRDNCVEGQGYCESNAKVCMGLKMLGAACEQDRECQSSNCNNFNVCVAPPESAVHVEKWVYAVIGLGLSLFMIAVICLLILMHRRAQAAKRIMLEDYYREQSAYRNSILSFHSALTSRTSLDKLDNASSTDLKRDHRKSWDRSSDRGSWEKERMVRSLSNLSDTTVVGDRR